MSGFDVRLAHARRSRAMVLFFTLGLGLVLTFGLLISRFPSYAEEQSREAASNQITLRHQRGSAQDAQSTELTSAALTQSPAPQTALVGVNLIEAEHEIFTGACATCIQDPGVDVTVRSGQTFASVLSDVGAERVEAARAIAALNPVYPARDLRAGQDLKVYFAPRKITRQDDDTGEAIEETVQALAGLSFRPDSERVITVARTYDGTFQTREALASFDQQMVRAQGEIDSNFYLAALESGATDRIVYEVAGVLGFAVDFRAIQAGDTFDVLFERMVDEEGSVARTGDVLYVNLNHRGRDLEYYRFETEDGIIGYYSPEGESAQRLLMKTPINGARLSSNFGRRFHPILRTSRPHNGTDFAAPRGTPIMAAGNGVVERANRFGSFGNYLRIRHANGYQTAYAHLNGFASGVRAGSRVTQGQIVAYVGTTGRSTGPHLHYEVHLNGTPINPMSLDLPTGRRLSDAELETFIAARDEIRAMRDASPAANSDFSQPLFAANTQAGDSQDSDGQTE
ncbi:M23 family metallopeptidase [Woodsholea maritima]|uniref:M23 family metallopeptidase n=1 Tax=Woodsholea maritima TaxID=240237 RepID=UPI00035E6BFA|nr:peptidoglycan DD-metalloendopeptidase family protein [Woodsholea maritima]